MIIIKEHPKVSISYSQTSDDHKEKVIYLYKRLRYDGVDAKLDLVDFKIGNDLDKKMEDMIKSDDMDYVIIISDKEYVNKANKRKGGVGTETKLLTHEIYGKPYQEKIVPLIWEYDGDKPCLPYYLENTFSIDFSDEEKFESNYDLLLRHIYKTPKLEEEPLGKKPPYLDNKEISFDNTRFSIDKLKKDIKKNPESINENSREFFDNFLKDLDSLTFEKIDDKNIELISQSLIKSLEKYKVLRDYFIDFFSLISKESYSEYLDPETITDFLEDFKLYNKYYSNEYTNESESILSYLIVYELFLYIITISFKNKNYHLAHDLIYNPYYFKDRNSEYDDEPKFYKEFNNHPLLFQKLNYYFPKWNYSALGRLLLNNINPHFDSENLVDVDLILFYIGLMNFNFRTSWYPNLYLFKNNEKIELLKKMSKKSFFEKFKIIFDVATSEEFVKKASIPNNVFQEYRFPNYLKSIVVITDSIKIENICKY